MSTKLKTSPTVRKSIGLALLSCLLFGATSVKAQSITQLGQQMAKQVNEIRSGSSVTMSSSDEGEATDAETAALIAGIPRPKGQTRSNLSLQHQYYSNFVGPIYSGKILVPAFNPNCTIADVDKYMSLPNVKKETQSSMLMYTLYKDNTEDEPLAMYTYMFMNGSFMMANVTFMIDIDRDKCLAWMVKHYKYKESDVEDGQDSHTFSTKDGKSNIVVNFTSMNGSTTHAIIMYGKEMD